MRCSPEEILGAKGEEIVRNWLIKNGYSILQASKIEDLGAPMLLGSDMKIILPDNMVWLEGKARWVEVKTKSYPTRHESWPQRLEHGLPLRHWAAYEAIQQCTQSDVTLAVLELESSCLLIQTLNKLKANERIYPMQGEWHIFLARDDFKIIHLQDMVLPHPIEPLAERSKIQVASRLQRKLW